MNEEATGRLFGADEERGPSRDADHHAPLAERMRPRCLEEVVGQDHLVGPGRLLRRLAEARTPVSLLFWGPPGVGKTTLARLLAEGTGARWVELSATAAGVREVRSAAQDARRLLRANGKRTVLFVDEIHRFHKGQQDALLPWVEDGSVIFVGATTENPSFQLVAPLLSRCRVVRLDPLDEEAIVALLGRALETPAPRGLKDQDVDASDEVLGRICRGADGDARVALNVLEIAVAGAAGAGVRKLRVEDVDEALQSPLPRYGKEEHFDQISALQKSVRNSDPDAAVYWIARMLEAGEDPRTVSRRLIRTASEDVGLADPRALEIALAGHRTVEAIGMPEAALALLQVAVYLAVAPKSNALESAWSEVRRVIRDTGALPVPKWLRNPVTGLMREQGYGEGYRYAHDEPGGVADMECLPAELVGRRFYEPGERGIETRIRERLREIEELRRRRSASPSSEPPEG